MSRLSIHKLRELKANGQRFAMITAYDYPSARLVEQAGVPVILVGDSLGSVILGYESTVPVTMDDIVYHTRAVVRGTSKAIVVADLPFMSYQPTPTTRFATLAGCSRKAALPPSSSKAAATSCPSSGAWSNAASPSWAISALPPRA